MRIELYNGGYVTDEVSSVDSNEANTTLENRIKFVTDVAAISRGKDSSNNPESRYKHLQKEAAVNMSVETLNEYEKDVNVANEKDVQDNINTVGRPFEFIPVKVYVMLRHDISAVRSEDGEILHTDVGMNNVISIISDLSRYGYMDVEEVGDTLHSAGGTVYTIYTNARNYVYVANKYDFLDKEIPYCKSEGFKVLRVCAPMHSWGQIMTHTGLSKISQSDRVSKQDNYWLPDDIIERLANIDTSKLECENLIDFIYHFRKVLIVDRETEETCTKEEIRARQRSYIIYNFLNILPQNKVQELLKLGGYKREIYSRAPYYFKYKEFVIGGWINDPRGFGHFLLERDAYDSIRTSWTQEETKTYAKAIKDVLNKN